MESSSPVGRAVVVLTAVVALVFLVAAGASLSAAPQAQVNVKLNGTMQPTGDVLGDLLMRISPDSRRVVYVADAQTENAFELYSAPTTGQAPPVRLSGLLPSGALVNRIAITPDSRRVVYVAPQETSGVSELFVVPIEGGPSLKLNGPLVAGGDVDRISLSPDW